EPPEPPTEAAPTHNEGTADPAPATGGSGPSNLGSEVDAAPAQSRGEASEPAARLPHPRVDGEAAPEDDVDAAESIGLAIASDPARRRGALDLLLWVLRRDPSRAAALRTLHELARNLGMGALAYATAE